VVSFSWAEQQDELAVESLALAEPAQSEVRVQRFHDPDRACHLVYRDLGRSTGCSPESSLKCHPSERDNEKWLRS